MEGTPSSRLSCLFVLLAHILHMIGIFRNSPDAIVHLTQTTNCSAVLVEATVSHLHVEIVRGHVATGVTPTIITPRPISSDATRDGVERARSFLAESKSLSAAALEEEAKGGAFYLHTSGTTVSDKGTVKTKATTLALYADDIERAYAVLEHGPDIATTMTVGDLPLRPGKPDMCMNDESAVRGFVETLVADAVGHRLGPEEDFFRNGLRAALGAAVGSGVPVSVPQNVVYAYPTCAALSRFLMGFVVASRPAADDLEMEVAEMVEKYSRDLPYHQGGHALPQADGDVYAVTGTTGSLGAAFMALLLAQPHVKKVYALNRRHGSQSITNRQEAAFVDKGLDPSLLREAVSAGSVDFVEFEAGKDRLRINGEIYSKALQLTQEVTYIVHIAWLLNFNLLLLHFEPHIAGVRSVLALALASSCERPPHITFVSSIGTTARCPFSECAVPEGYSYPKSVSEQVIQHAVAQRPSLRAPIVRCGQLSGALATGAWQKSEYVPRLLRSAHALGMIPTDVADVRWLPADVAADILLREIRQAATHPTPGPVRYYTLETSRCTPWRRVVDPLAAFEPDGELKKVPMSTFLAEVRKDATSSAFAVAEYLDDLLISHPVPKLSVTQARRVAGDLVDCEIGEEVLKREFVDGKGIASSGVGMRRFDRPSNRQT
ncbi:hypothetical protein V8D89_015611 [Ganoderma adspersum]